MAENEEAVLQLGDQTLKTIATELLRQIRANASVDWQKRESMRAQLRLMVKRILRKHRYPPEKDGTYDKSISLVIEQAEELSREWTA